MRRMRKRNQGQKTRQERLLMVPQLTRFPDRRTRWVCTFCGAPMRANNESGLRYACAGGPEAA